MNGDPAGDLTLILGLFLELRRGMEEFRRAYGIELARDGAVPATNAEDFARRLSNPAEREAARRELAEAVQAIKLHQIALIEGYNEATHSGSTKLIDSLDPEKLRDLFERARIKVGPLSLPGSWRPVLVQAIWEEILRRTRQYRALDEAQFERFYREGFQAGYRKFWEARGGAATSGSREGT